jgi:hypothetical protein
MEAEGDRAGAARLRSDATDAYSRAWDERARRRLETLLRHATRPTPDDRRHGRPRGVAHTTPRRQVTAPER